MRHAIKQEDVDRFLDETPWRGPNDDSRDLAEELEHSCAIFLGWDWQDLLPFVKDWQRRAKEKSQPVPTTPEQG